MHGAGTDEPVLWYEGSGTGAANRRWLDADERGSIVRVTDDTAATLAVNSYDEYGIPGANNLGRFQYTGQMWIPELGLYYYKARMYSPTLGRFLQTDPIGYADGLNWYNYVGSDPVNRIDPTGLQCGSMGARAAPAVLANDPVNRTDPSGEEGDDIVVTAKRFIPALTFLRNFISIPNVLLYAVTAQPLGSGMIHLKPSDQVDNTVHDITKNGKVTRDDAKLKNVNRGGGPSQAQKDWNQLVKSAQAQEQTITTQYGPGKSIDLPGGGSASIRPGSNSTGGTTIQISNRPGLPTQAKFRY